MGDITVAKNDIGLFTELELAVLVPKTDRAKLFFKEEFGVPDGYGLDVTKIGPDGILDLIPRYFTFVTDKKEPKKIHKHLFQ